MEAALASGNQEPLDDQTAAEPARARLIRKLRELGVIAVFIAMVAYFSLARPESFPTSGNLRNILVGAVVLSVLAGGLTVVLALGEFDLSFAAVVGLSGAISIIIMRDLHAPAAVAVIGAMACGGAVGLVNGLIVGYGRVPAFIGTLAVSSVAAGLEEALMHSNTVYEGITKGYLSIASKEVAGIPLEIVYGAIVIVVLWVILAFTTFGRRVYATGDNEEAARVAGVRTKRVKLMAFVVLGVCAGLAGVLVTSEGGSYFPNSGSPFLLPAYAAAFLGLTAIGGRRFHPVATAFGVIFTAVLSTGLTIMNAPPAATSLSQGAVLGFAVLLGRPRS
jgi:ribose transport system permease protein